MTNLRNLITLCAGLLAGLLVGSTAIADSREIAELPPDREVLFRRDVAPVLKKNCVACHNESEEEGGVNLETVNRMMASEVDDLLIPGKPDASRLFLLAAHADEPVMPPEDNDVSAAALNPIELALLRRWIELGAKVDAASTPSPAMSWQPLPSSLRTIFGSATTPDGRLSVVSFGNQIGVFGAGASASLATLEQVAGDETRAAHDDFVQDLFIDPSGRRIVSAGYRNIKFWELKPLESAAIPSINANDVAAVAMNGAGTHLATLSPRGELSVAKLGMNRWEWMKGFDLPGDLQAENGAKPILEVDESGQTVAVGWGTRVFVVGIERAAVETLECESELAALDWGDVNHLICGDRLGKVRSWSRDTDQWSSQVEDAFDQPITDVRYVPGAANRIVVVDATGRIAIKGEGQAGYEQLGKLPEPAKQIAVIDGGEALWVATATGTIGKFSLSEKKFVEVSKTDPLIGEQYADQQWATLAGERLVAANEKDQAQAEANVKAEQESLEKISQDIEAKTKTRDEKQQAANAAKQAAEDANKKLADAKTAEDDAKKQREGLTESLKGLDASIAELEKQLAEMKGKKAEVEKQLAAIPEAAKLAETVKTAGEAAAKADQDASTKQGELDAAIRALQSAEETKTRGESRLQGLSEDVEQWKGVVQQSKDEQAKHKQTETATKAVLDQSKAADQAFAAVAGGSRVITRSGASGGWSLWSGAGDWIAKATELDGTQEIIAAGRSGMLMKTSAGEVVAMRVASQDWRQTGSVGAATGESPFADRVLCVDVDPLGRLLATGGGEPSRNGELMIWNAADGTLVRRIEKPHGDTVLCLRFSPDGKVLASGGADRMIKLWDVETGNLIKTLEGHTHHVTSIDWNVNRRQLASASADASVKIWDVETGKASRTISGLKSEVTKLVYVGRDDRIGITCGDGYFRVYRTDNGGRETNAKLPGGYLYALDANRQGTQFIVGGGEGKAVLVDKSGKQLQEYQLE